MCGPTSGSRSFSLGPSASPGLALSGDLRPLASGGARGDNGRRGRGPERSSPSDGGPSDGGPSDGGSVRGDRRRGSRPARGSHLRCRPRRRASGRARYRPERGGAPRLQRDARRAGQRVRPPPPVLGPGPRHALRAGPAPQLHPRSSRGCGGGSTVLSTRPPSGRRPCAVVWTRFSRARPRSSTTMRPRTS